MKKKLIPALCLCTLLCSCTNGASGDKSDSENSQKADAVSSSQSVSDSDDKTAENAYEQRIAELEQQVQNLGKYLSIATEDDMDSILQGEVEDWDIAGEVHEVYDDTAVIAAYNAGSPEGLNEMDSYIYENLVKAIDEIITDDMTEFDKEKAVYDYIFYGTRFNENSLSAIQNEDNSHNPYGFFHDHTTICVGNATTFKLFMDALGIECGIIHSVEEGEHAWNIVKINGKWYHSDVTFDSGYNQPLYTQFNVPDSVKDAMDYPWDHDEFPECNSVDDCLVYKNAIEIKDVYEIPKTIGENFAEDKSIYMKMPCTQEEYDRYFDDILDVILYGIQSEDENSYCFVNNPCCLDGYVVFGVSFGEIENFEDLPSEIEGNIDFDKLAEEFDKYLDGYTFAIDYYDY